MLYENHAIKEDRLEFLLRTTPKHQRKGVLKPMVIKKIRHKKIDAMECLKNYMEITRPWRDMEDGIVRDNLFLSYVGKHGEVKTCSITKWLRMGMEWAGVDTTRFKPHSIRGASASRAYHTKSVSIKAIMDRGQWKSESILKKYYIRDV